MSGPSTQSRLPTRGETGEQGRKGKRILCIFSNGAPSPFKTTRSCQGQGFDSISRLREHLSRCHSEKKLHQCLSCFKCFESAWSLEEHKKTAPHKVSRRAPGSANKEQEILGQYQAIHTFFLPHSELPISPYALSPSIRAFVNGPPPRLRDEISSSLEAHGRQHGLSGVQVEATKDFVWQLFTRTLEMCGPLQTDAQEPDFSSISPGPTNAYAMPTSSQSSYVNATYDPHSPESILYAAYPEYIDPNTLYLHSQNVTPGFDDFQQG